MARVEWTRLEGGDVEAVVGMFICSRFPNAVRVRPSQGDGGVDIFVPGDGGFATEREVFQVKKYFTNLTSSQKREITRSFTRVVAASLKEGWTITKWHLVMPLDVTDHNLANWLKELTEGAEFPCEPLGLLFCDTLAGQYPEVVDYYLRDGRERLENAVANLTAVIAGRPLWQQGGTLSVNDVSGDLAAMHRALNNSDPFYRYDFAVSDASPDRSAVPVEPGLVAVYGRRHDSAWIAVKIYARSLAALEERPITGHLKFAISPEDEHLRKEFENFIDYGAPVSMPAGTVDGSLDLPGGLGGDISGSSLRMLSVPDDDSQIEPAEIAIAMVAPDSDTVLASAIVHRVEFTTGLAGARSVWRDKADLFTIETLVAGGELRAQMTLRVDEYDLQGRRPSELVESLKFMANMHAPNRIALSLSYGPRNYSVVATAGWKPDELAVFWAPVCEALTLIQDHVNVLLRMPAAVSARDADRINDVARLLSGDALYDKGLRNFQIDHDGDQAERLEASGIYDFITVHTMAFRLGDVVIVVGKQARLFRGRCIEIGQTQSTVEPEPGTDVTMRYEGSLNPGQVRTRHIACEISGRPDVKKGASSAEPSEN